MKWLKMLHLTACLTALTMPMAVAEGTPAMDEAAAASEGGNNPNLVYDNARSKSEGSEKDDKSAVTDKSSHDESSVSESSESEDSGESGGFFKSKTTWIVGGAVLLAGAGFLFGGPIGALIGAAGGAAIGWLAHLLFM